MALRAVGRLAFPLFCFLLAEGFCHTRDRQRYALQLLIFALLSEIPFDLAFALAPFAPGGQNVYFTLFLGVLSLQLLVWLEGRALLQVLGVGVRASGPPLPPPHLPIQRRKGAGPQVVFLLVLPPAPAASLGARPADRPAPVRENPSPALPLCPPSHGKTGGKGGYASALAPAPHRP